MHFYFAFFWFSVIIVWTYRYFSSHIKICIPSSQSNWRGSYGFILPCLNDPITCLFSYFSIGCLVWGWTQWWTKPRLFLLFLYLHWVLRCIYSTCRWFIILLIYNHNMNQHRSILKISLLKWEVCVVSEMGTCIRNATFNILTNASRFYI